MVVLIRSCIRVDHFSKIARVIRDGITVQGGDHLI